MEKIEPSAFSSGAAVQGMMNQMEELYAARFSMSISDGVQLCVLTNDIAHGDNKVAKTRLRGGQARLKSHHFSVLRTGLLLGIALPAFVDAIYLSE